jgi:hypothetical protein
MVYFGTIGYGAIMMFPNGSVEQFAAISPSFSEVSVRVYFVTYAYITTISKGHKLKRSSGCHTTFAQSLRHQQVDNEPVTLDQPGI